jgi:hypothetical protein
MTQDHADPSRLTACRPEVEGFLQDRSRLFLLTAHQPYMAEIRRRGCQQLAVAPIGGYGSASFEHCNSLAELAAADRRG